MAATTTLLGLVTPTQGTLSGTWGDTVNYGISDYVDIAIAGTLSFAGDGAITLANTTGSSSGNAITSTTAQYMVIRITGTQTVTKVITGPSYSKLYMVDHAGATSAVTFKAAGQTGVTVVVGEKCFVYYNGTDYVKVASSVAGVTSFTAGTTGFTPSTAATGAVTLAGTLATANGGTNLGGATPFTANGVVYASSASVLATGSGLVFDATNVLLGIGISSGFRTAAGYGIQAINGTTGSLIDLYVGGVRLGGISSTGVSTNIGSITALPLTFSTNDTVRATVDSIGYLSGVWADKVTALGNSGTATTITCTAGNVFTATLTGNCTFTLAAPSSTTANTATSFTLILTNDATASRTVAWAGGTFKFPGGSVTRTTTANATDIWFFFSPNGGTTWYGSIPMANLS
jgi:hypothetical protein